MKPTHKNFIGEKYYFINIKHKVDINAIEITIMKLLDTDDKIKITHTIIEDKLKEIFYNEGSDGIRGVGVLDDDNWTTEDIGLLTIQAKEISKKLFPDFY